MSIQTLLAFAGASLLLALLPGPDNIFVLMQSALRGRLAGFLVVLGLCTGLVVHTTAVALGVAVIFKTSLLAFTVLKIAGACYLAYLAWLAWRAPVAGLQAGVQAAPLRSLYLRGIVMNVTNPKVSIFFLAFLPQFADPAQGSITAQMCLLGGVFMACTLLVFGGIALLAGTVSAWFSRSARVQRGLNRLAGVIFLGLALKLMTTRQ